MQKKMPKVTSDKLPDPFQITLYSLINNKENFSLQQKSLEALFCTPLKLHVHG